MLKLVGTLGFPNGNLAIPDQGAAVSGTSVLQQANNVSQTVSVAQSSKAGKSTQVSKLKNDLLAVNKTDLLPQGRGQFLAPRTRTQAFPRSSKAHSSATGPMMMVAQTAAQRERHFAVYLDLHAKRPGIRSVAARETLVSLLNSINIDPQNRVELDEAQSRVLLFCDRSTDLKVTGFTREQMRSLNDAVLHNYVKNLLKEGGDIDVFAEAFALYGKLLHPGDDAYRKIAKAYAGHLLNGLENSLPNNASDMASARSSLDCLKKSNEVLRDGYISKKFLELSDKIHRHYAGQCMNSQQAPKLDRLREAYSAQKQIVFFSPLAAEEFFQIKLHYAHELLKCRVETADSTEQAQLWRAELLSLKQEILAERPDLLLSHPELA